jgi:hypothetical protein
VSAKIKRNHSLLDHNAALPSLSHYFGQYLLGLCREMPFSRIELVHLQPEVEGLHYQEDSMSEGLKENSAGNLEQRFQIPTNDPNRGSSLKYCPKPCQQRQLIKRTRIKQGMQPDFNIDGWSSLQFASISIFACLTSTAKRRDKKQ